MNTNAISKNDNTNISENHEIGIENDKNSNLFQDKQKNTLNSNIENNKESKNNSYDNENFKEVIIDNSKNKASNIINNEHSFNTNKNENNNFSIDISKSENLKENSSQRVLKTKKNKINPKKNRDTKSMQKDSSNILINNLGNINDDINKTNYNGDDEQKIIEELRKKNNSNLYLYYVIKYIPFKKRKKYLSESEMENLPYEYALKIEDRNKSDFYFSLLREKNQIISICINDKDFNILNAKIALFIFHFNLAFVINAIFFTDETIYMINQNDGSSLNLRTQISRIVYSAIISRVIVYFVELLFFIHHSIIKLRYYEDIKKAEDSVPILLRTLKIKIMVFFIIITFFDILFFYYITAFCSVYTIIQIQLIKDSFICFLLLNLYSVILFMFASSIRIFSLKKKSKFRYLLYLIS